MTCYNVNGLNQLIASGYEGEFWSIGVDFWKEGESAPYDGYSVLFYDDEQEADGAMETYATASGVKQLLDILGFDVECGDTVQMIYETGEIADGDFNVEKTDWQEYFEKQADGSYFRR